MRFATPLVPGRLIRRYMRFLADVELDDGRIVKAHCPNTGAMLGLKSPGLRVWLEPNEDPKKKLDWGWRLAELPGGHWAGIDSSLPNRIMRDALMAQSIPELSDYDGVRPEVKYGQNSRVDFLLTGPDLPSVYLEVKNVHLLRSGDLAEFPDSVTDRGTKHLQELTKVVADGHRAIMFYFVQRTDCGQFAVAADIDPAYAHAFEIALDAGVEVMCYDTDISPQGIWLRRRIAL